MKILKRYILKEHIAPFFIALMVVTFVLLSDRIIDLLNLIIEKKLPWQTVFEVFGLSLPYMLALSIPMAVLVATILAFGRMSVDREIVAIKSSGINVYSNRTSGNRCRAVNRIDGVFQPLVFARYKS